MSFMPGEGSKVRMMDGRHGVVSKVSPLGVIFDDGREESIDICQIAEVEMDIEQAEDAEFKRFIETTAKEVGTWPEWKKKLWNAQEKHYKEQMKIV